MNTSLQCPNCESFNTVTDSPKKWLAYAVGFLIMAIALYQVSNSIVQILGFIAAVVSIAFFIKAFYQNGVSHFCKACKNKWTNP